MANLMGQGSFYPHGKPARFSYTKHFVEEYGYDTGYLAKENTLYPGLDGEDNSYIIDRALKNLDILRQGAKQAEIAFIQDTGININDINNSKEIFKSINLILNSKQTFERGIRYMKSIQSSENPKKEEMYRDVSRYFSSYLEGAIKTAMDAAGLRGPGSAKRIALLTKPEVEQLINNIITQALDDTYTHVKDFIKKDNISIRGKFGKKAEKRELEEEIQAITDMLDIIRTLGKNGAFSKFGYLFDMKIEDLIENNNQGVVDLKYKKFNKAKVDTNFGGNALELITTTVAPYLANINITTPNIIITSEHTGQKNQMKADTLLFIGQATVNPADYMEYVNTDIRGVRAQNVDALERYLQDLNEQVQHVIAISDKNYSIKSSFDGIAVQEKMDLESAMKLLRVFGLDKRQLLDLINYLANCGDSMIQGTVADAVRTELQTYIGYFLFDKLEIDIKGNNTTNVVNLMNISGMYVPLSIILDGLYNSIKEATRSPSSLVSVTISLGGPTEQNVWTRDTWMTFRREHQQESFISYRILRDFADFITSLAY